MEVSYFPEGGSITDYVCEMFDTKVGVSVTRAMKYRGDFADEDAEHLLNKKLRGKIYSVHKMFLSKVLVLLSWAMLHLRFELGLRNRLFWQRYIYRRHMGWCVLKPCPAPHPAKHYSKAQ